MKTMKFTLRSVSFAAAIVLSGAAVAAPGGADITITPPANGGFVIKNNAGNAERLRVMETGDVYLPNLSNTTEAGSVACYDDATGRLGSAQQARLWGTRVQREQPERPVPQDRRARPEPPARQDRRAPQVRLAFKAQRARQALKAPLVPRAFKVRRGRRVILACLVPQVPQALQAHRVVKPS